MDNTDPVWLTVNEFSTLIRMPRSTVYEAVANGRLEHRRIGGSIRIHREAGIVAADGQPHRQSRKPRLVVVRTQRRAAR